MDIKEQVAKICNRAEYGDGCSVNWEHSTLYEKDDAYEKADQILALPKIKQALSLLELFEQGKLAKIADDQTAPEPSLSCCSYREASHNIIHWLQRQSCNVYFTDMLNAGFKKVEDI